jgi:hypothetical protein
MEEKSYAFLVEDEVFNIFDAIGLNEAIAQDYYDGFLNNPQAVNLKYYPLAMRGDIWNGKNFVEDPSGDYISYDGTKMEKHNMKIPDPSQFARFGFVANNKLFFVLVVSKDSPEFEMFDTAFSNQVTVMDITEYSDIERGDFWNGHMFIKPNNTSIHRDKSSNWQKWKDNLGDTRPWHMVMPGTKKVSTALAAERMSICNSCPELIKLTTTCKKCGCFMKLKTRLDGANCPLGKW